MDCFGGGLNNSKNMCCYINFHLYKSIFMDPSKEENLTIALNALYSSILIIYSEFKPYFKAFALLVAAFLAHKLGQHSNTQPITKKVRKLSAEITKKEKDKEEIPKRIQQLGKKVKRFSILFILVIAILGVLTVTKKVLITTTVWVGVLVTGFLFIIYLVMTKKVLIEKQKKVGDRERKIRESLKELVEMFGKKVQNNLRLNLCREKILNHQKVPTNVCTRNACKELRENLRIRYEAIRDLAEAALTFEWCTICKRRQPFNEYLSCELNELIKKEDCSEQEEVQARIQYLITGCESMVKWIKQVNPCNCSKLYMEQILKEKKAFNQIDRKTSEKIKMLERGRPMRSQQRNK